MYPLSPYLDQIMRVVGDEGVCTTIQVRVTLTVLYYRLHTVECGNRGGGAGAGARACFWALIEVGS